MIVRSGIMALVLAALGCGVTIEPEPDVDGSFEDARIVLAARRGGNGDIYVVGSDGHEIRRLTTDDAADNYPAVSPDGRTLAFQSRRGSQMIDIFVQPFAGGPSVNLTDDPGHDVLPTWSPDGTRLAFMSTRGFELGGPTPFPGHLYLVGADGTGLRQVTQKPLDSPLGPQDWTPDGRHLLLSRRVDGQLDIFLLELDSGQETRLTSDGEDEYGGDVSPDGTRIAFHAESEDASQLGVMRFDGSERRILTSGPGRRYGPRWSPDGKWLLYTAQGEGDQYDIRALRLEDGHDVAIVATPEDEREADWLSPTKDSATSDGGQGV